MNYMENEVRVKDETICECQSISETKLNSEFLNKRIKEEPIDNVQVKVEEKFSAREEFTNRISIAF